MPAKIVSTHSFRGGTGKSNTTANLAAATSSLGYRVAIVDTDIQSPGVHVLFNMDEHSIGHTLNDYLWGRCGIEEAAHDLTPPHVAEQGGKIFLIPSSMKANDIARVLREGYDVNLLNEGFQDLLEKLNLDFLFIDTHPGLNEETLLSITISDVLVLVLRPDKQDFQGTAVTVDVARKLGVPKMLLVVNKVLTSYDFDEVKQKVEATYNAPVGGVLPQSDEMMQLAGEGVFCFHYPDHPLTKVVADIAQLILTDD